MNRMGARKGLIVGGSVYHVCNRGSRKGDLFTSCEDYEAFEGLMEEARRKRPIRILAYHLMPTHFHFLLWPEGDDDLPQYMHWLTSTHAKRWHRARNSIGTGAVYQSRYRAVLIKDDRQLLNAWRYIDRNALTAGLVVQAEDWRWCSASRVPREEPPFRIDPFWFQLPENWLTVVNDL